jgi:hypothetical protein
LERHQSRLHGWHVGFGRFGETEADLKLRRGGGNAWASGVLRGNGWAARGGSTRTKRRRIGSSFFMAVKNAIYEFQTGCHEWSFRRYVKMAGCLSHPDGPTISFSGGAVGEFLG